MSDFDFEELSDLSAETHSDNAPLNISDYKFCEDCNVIMDSDINNSLTCRECGFIKQISTENTEYEPSMNGYNTNSNFHIPIKCVGANSFQYQKQLRNTTSHYPLVQESNLRRRLERLNYKSDGIIIPKCVIQKVIAQYKLVRETDKIHRGDIFNGIIGSLIYYECIKSGIVRKHKEISDWYGITESDMSKGDKIIRNLEEQGVLQLPIYDNNDEIYVESYLKRSKLTLGYKYFMLDLIKVVEEKRIGNHNARLSTKVSAVLYLISTCSIKEDSPIFCIADTSTITPDFISKEFSISVSTFKSFYNAIISSKHVTDVFDKYGITPQKKKLRSAKNAS